MVAGHWDGRCRGHSLHGSVTNTVFEDEAAAGGTAPAEAGPAAVGVAVPCDSGQQQGEQQQGAEGEEEDARR